MENKTVLKAVWTTHSGFPAAIIRTNMGHLCGYVKVPAGHPCYGHESEYDEPLDKIRCHGGLTYAEFNNTNYPVTETESGGYWIGFDCGHAYDGRDKEFMDDYKKNGFPENCVDLFEGHVWTVPEVTNECESIATQLKDMQP